MTSVEKCLTCKWFKQGEGKTGACIRYPPVPHPVGPEQVTSFWPAVTADHVCGEWKMKIYSVGDMPEGVTRQ